MAHPLQTFPSPVNRGNFAVRSIPSALISMVVVAGVTGCLYTDPINRPPMITIAAPSAQILRGESATFMAVPSDPDGDSVTVQWMLDTSNRCPSARSDYEDERNWPPVERHSGMSYAMDGSQTQNPFCVWAVATDRLGAVGVAEPLQVDPGKHPPVARIDIVTPLGVAKFPLYTELKFSGAQSVADPDDDHFWTVTPAAPRCADDLSSTSTSICLMPDHDGSYTIELTIVDPTTQLRSTATRTVQVQEDQLPCIAMTSPDLVASSIQQNPGTPRRLSVSQVTDDGDPFPSPIPLPPQTGAPEFRWFIGSTTETLRYVGNDLPEFNLAENQFSFGDEVKVRVEVRDRDKQRMDRVLSNCGDQPLCAGDPARPTCFQRVTWTISFVL